MLKSSNQFKERIQFGEHLLQNGKINEALEIFDDVLDKEPDNIIALNDKGVALNTLGRYQDAIQNLLKAIQIDSNNSNAIFNLISNYFAIGKWREAENTLFEYEQFLSQEDIEIIKDDLQETKQVIQDVNSLKSLNLSINQNSVSGSLKLYLDTNKFSQKIMWGLFAKNHVYEPETFQFFSNALKDGDCFIDIGAHIGYFSLCASLMVGNEGQVFSFEPETANYIHLNTHIVENNLNNIQTANAALGTKSRKGQFFVNLDNDGGHALWNVGLHDFNKKSRANQTTKDINILSLDDVFRDRELNSLRLIKIDTEGAEHDVLRGGIDTIKKYNYPYIICEINRFGLQQMGTSEDALRRFVYELGYNTYLLSDSSSNIVELLPEHHVETDYIFNLLFAKEETLRKDGFLIMANIKDIYQEALRLHQDGNLTQTATFYHLILQKQPGHVDANFLLGTLNIQRANLDKATMYLKKTIALKPDYVAAYNNLGTALQSQGKLSEAVVIYNRVIDLKPDYAEARINLGNVLQEQGKLEEAMEYYNRAIELQPDYAEAHYNLGNALRKKCKPDEAASCFSKAIELKPDYAEAHSNLGSVLQEQGKLDEAVASHRKTIELNPNNAEVHNNLGNMLQEQGKLDEAAVRYKKTITLKPDHTKAHNNLGAVLQEQGKYDEAMEYYKQAISLKPDYAEAHMNRSFVLMLTGNLEAGWPEYEWRLHTKDRISRTFQQPLWNGTPLDGRSILVHAEQGLGDTIQFVRYLPMVQAKGGHVTFECQKNLFRLLKNNEGFDEIIEKASANEENSHFDVQVPLLSLPGIFGTTFENIPSNVPYITVDPEPVKQWNTRIEHNDDFKIGIVWAGSLHHRNDRNRSCKLEDFAQLTEIPGLAFYSLQKGQASVEVNNPPKGMNIINLTDELNDFTDTAAIIANLDLVISIDTSVAHLAGAIGKPVWNLLPFAPDWRWFLNRDDSPWYPRTENAEDFPRTENAEDFPRPRQNDVARPDDLVGRGQANGLAGRAGMRLFRQTKPNDWAGVFEQVEKALLNKLNTGRQISEGKRLAVRSWK